MLAGCGPAPVTPAPPPAAVAPAPASESFAAPPPPNEDLRVGSRPWIDATGTAIVGFGVLRLVPDPGKTARFDFRYDEKPGDYGAGAGDDFQFFALPGDAFAKKTSAYADQFLFFTRTHGSLSGTTYTLRASIQAASEMLVIVGYGPWTAPDSGRPSGDRPVFRIDVTPRNGAFEWLESEAGELITTNWTNRPGVKRGGPYSKEDVWIEVRPLILYDGRMVRADGEPDAAADVYQEPDLQGSDVARDALDREEFNADMRAAAARLDRRIVMTRELAEKFRRVPIRWR